MDEEIPKDVKNLEERRVLSVSILEALDSLEKSQEWNTLKELVFNKALERIDTLLLSEAKKPIVDVNKIYVLQGERNWALRYCDIKRFVEFHKTLLEEVNRQLK